MALSLRQLLTPVTTDQVVTGILGLLQGFGFQATAWQEGEPARTIVEAVGSLISDATYAIAGIAGSVHAGLASGPYADLIGQYQFQLNRVSATPTRGVMILTASLAAPPQTFAANSLLIADSAADDAHTYTVDTGATINPGDVLTVSVTAAVPGSGSNIAPGQPALELRTAMVGITVTNPPQPPTTPPTTWITSLGLDPETDGVGGRYNARMMGRWSRLSPNNIEGAYRAWVLEGVPAVTRLSVRTGVGVMTVHVTAATAAGGISDPQIAAISDYLNGVTDGVGRRPINDVLEIVAANQLTAPALNVSITVHSPFASDAVARVTQALSALIGDPVSAPIGGKVLPGASGGVFLLSDLYATVRAQQGIVDVAFPSLTGNVALGQDDIWTPAIAVTMVIIP